jgi:hypothetical protein
MHPQAYRKIFGWIKSTEGLGKLIVRGLEKARAAFILALATVDLVRLPKLPVAPPWGSGATG